MVSLDAVARIEALAKCLGTADGLKRVESEVNDLCEQIGARPPSRAELIELAASLAVLADRIYQFDNIVRCRIRALGGETHHVG
jgi:hypothetical protein